jgi:hypothetical protein
MSQKGLTRSTADYLRESGLKSEQFGNLGVSVATDGNMLDEVCKCECSDRCGLLCVTRPIVIIRAFGHSNSNRIDGMKEEQGASMIHRVEFALETDLTKSAAVTQQRLAIHCPSPKAK